MKNQLLSVVLLLASNCYAETCLIRKDDVVHPTLKTEPISLKKDLIQPVYIDYAAVQTDCHSDACKIEKNDVFLLKRGFLKDTLYWISGSGITYLDVKLNKKNSAGLSMNFLKSESNNGYTYYLIKNGDTACNLIPRWVGKYTDERCSLYTVEVFETNPDSEMDKKYIKPDDSRAKLDVCVGSLQPGTGSGGEPPP